MQSAHGQASSLLLLLLLLPSALSSSHGKPNKTRTYRISGGSRDPEVVKYARYMVSIRTRLPARYFGDNHFCSGVIVAPSWILTAGHCVMDIRKVPTRARAMTVVAGTSNRLKKVSTTVIMQVSYVKPHPNFTLFSRNDIALMRLKGRLPVNNPMIDVMPLPTGKPPYGTDCVTLGWGRMYYNGPLAARISHITVRLFKEEKCKEAHPHYILGDMCASGDRGRDMDSCRGDSGGPLICNEFVTGITSWTIGCGTRAYPGIYSNVNYNMKWITEIMSGAERKVLAVPLLLLILVSCLTLFDYICKLFSNMRNVCKC